MRILKYLGLILLVTAFITSCKGGEDPEAAAKLKEAGELHDASLAVRNEVSKMLSESEGLIAAVKVIIPTLEGKETQLDANGYIDAIGDAQKDYTIWEDELVEVPGHAHAHQEGGGHHHHNHSMDNASPEDILKKQKELKDFIDDIKNRLTKAIEMAQSVVDENTVE